MHQCTRQKPMFKQQTLFDPWQSAPPSPSPEPPTGKADTSRAAAASVAHKFSKRQRIALAHFRGRGARGATIEELAIACGWLLQSTCGVSNSLSRVGLIRDSGQRRTTSTGNMAKVWTAAE